MSDRRVRALIIEDNRDAAETLSLVLDQVSCESVIAHTGLEGIAAARANQPDIVFCDIGLPGLDGYSVARQLRAEKWGSRVTLVAVTAYGREEDRRRAEEAGFDLHFVKPADPQAIQRLFKDVGQRRAEALRTPPLPNGGLRKASTHPAKLTQPIRSSGGVVPPKVRSPRSR